MNLEQLISKYIDGELSHEEDLRLRELLNKDEEAREVFDSSLDIHLAAKEDAQSIEPSDEIVRKTEDLVLMRIMGQAQAKAAPVKNRSAKARTSRLRRPALALAVSMLLLFTAYNIYDQNDIIPSGNSGGAVFSDDINEENDNNLASMDIESSEENSNTNTQLSDPVSGESEITRVSNNQRLIPATGIELMADIDAQPFGPAEMILNESLDIAAVANEPAEEKPIVNFESTPVNKSSGSFNNAFNSGRGNNTISAMQSAPSITYGIDPGLSGQGYAMVPFNEFYEVRLTTTVANSMLQNGINTADGSNIMHYSQSIGFTPDRVSSYGFEFGYTEFQYNEEAIVKLPAGNSFSQIEELDPSSTDYIETTMIMKKDNRTFWGTAFYERVLIDTDYLRFSGRLGLGASRDGALGITRFTGHYELMDNFYLNLGAEGRLFMAKVPRLSSGRSDWNSTISLIYGIQLNF